MLIEHITYGLRGFMCNYATCTIKNVNVGIVWLCWLHNQHTLSVPSSTTDGKFFSSPELNIEKKIDH